MLSKVSVGDLVRVEAWRGDDRAGPPARHRGPHRVVDVHDSFSAPLSPTHPPLQYGDPCCTLECPPECAPPREPIHAPASELRADAFGVDTSERLALEEARAALRARGRE